MSRNTAFAPLKFYMFNIILICSPQITQIDTCLLYTSRMSRMIARDRNYSAIVTWSIGNESGYGKHFETLYDYTKKIDPTLSLIHISAN